MAKTYNVFARAYAGVIKRGRREIEDVRPDELKQDVIELLALEGLGPDGKPLPKEPEKPDEEVEEPKDGTTEEVEEEEPVEEVEEEEPSKDTKKEDKSPVEEDKGAK